MRRYKVVVKEPNGYRKFTRPSRRSIRCELALLWDEHPNAQRIEIQSVTEVQS